MISDNLDADSVLHTVDPLHQGSVGSSYVPQDLDMRDILPRSAGRSNQCALYRADEAAAMH